MSFVAIVDIGKLQVFDNVAGQHMVAVYRKAKDVEEFVYKRLLNDLHGINSKYDDESVSVRTLLNDSIITASSEIRFEIDQILWRETIDLGEICEVSQGVVEAPDKLSRKHVENTNRQDVNVKDGVFVLTQKEYTQMGFTKEEKQLIVPYLDPSDVQRFCISPTVNKYLIYADEAARGAIATRKEYRFLKKHLDHFSEFITSSNGPYGLHRPRQYRYFISPKILFKNMFVRPDFALDLEGHFVGFSFSCVIQKDKTLDLKYVLAVLNSSIGFYWFDINGKKRGAGVDIGVEKLRLFPIRRISQEEQLKIILLVDKVTAKKSTHPQADTSVLEREIDRLVYRLYDLTPAEIDIVEASVRK